MRNHLFTCCLFLMIHHCASAQKDDFYYPNLVNFNLTYSNALFYNLNGKPVSFSGWNFGMFLDYDTKTGIYAQVNYYFPRTFDGQVALLSMYDTVSPHQKQMDAKLKGGGYGFDFNFLTKFRHFSYESKSEDFCVRPMIGVTLLMHTASYTDSELDYDRLTYYAPVFQGLDIGSVNAGFYIRARVIGFPLCFLISHNFLIGRTSYFYKGKEKNYSTYLHVGLGLTFPVIKGPGVSKIRYIHCTECK